jgi:hypothetical protein
MRYTVTCPQGVQDRLALIWIQATDKSAISRASNRIDVLLRQSPDRGVDLGTHWAMVVDPLTVLYTTSSDDCQVAILDFIYSG